MEDNNLEDAALAKAITDGQTGEFTDTDEFLKLLTE